MRISRRGGGPAAEISLVALTLVAVGTITQAVGIGPVTTALTGPVRFLEQRE